MKRNSVIEYQHAMLRRAGSPSRLLELSRDVVVERGATFVDASVVPGWLRRTRPLALPKAPQDDFGAAIRVLQRHNKLLVRRFGVGWAAAASVVATEAQRRGVSPSYVARLLATGLRSDQLREGA